jgi:hypothetical protein
MKGRLLLLLLSVQVIFFAGGASGTCTTSLFVLPIALTLSAPNGSAVISVSGISEDYENVTLCAKGLLLDRPVLQPGETSTIWANGKLGLSKLSATVVNPLCPSGVTLDVTVFVEPASAGSSATLDSSCS